MALPSQQMFGGARGLAPYRPFYERSGTTDNTIGSVTNRYLGKYAAGLTSPRETEAFEEAKKIVRGNRESLRQGNFAAGLAGGGNWREFDDYAAVRKQTEALLGRTFEMGGIDGGGDVSQRPLSGMGDTMPVNTPRPTGAPGATTMYNPHESVADYQRRSEAADLALESLRRRGRAEQYGLESKLLTEMEDNQFAAGTPNAYTRRDMLDAQNLDFGVRRGRANSQLASENYWQREEPIARHKTDLQEGVLDQANTRALRLQDTKNAGALQSAVAKLTMAKDKNEAAMAMAQLRALTARLGNMTQYGEDTTALDQQFAERLAGSSLSPNQQGPGAEGIRGSRLGERLSDGRETWEWDGREWKRVG